MPQAAIEPLPAFHAKLPEMTEIQPERVDEALIALRRILRAAELFARSLARAAGLTPAQLRVLQIIDGRGGSTTPKTLSEQMGVKSGHSHGPRRQAGRP